jgi:uncharacterized membrane protein (Fun14 family)
MQESIGQQVTSILPDWDWTALGKELGLGGVLGFAVGFAAKKAIKLVLVVAALLLLLAVALETQGIISIHWTALEASYTKALRPEEVATSLRRLAQNVGRMIPLSGGFVLGCVIGFRRG